MKVGVIGSGRIGAALARLLSQNGHEVMIGTRKDPDSLASTVNDMPGLVRAGSIDEAARFGDVDFVAIPFGAIDELPGDAFAGKVVVDANNYYPRRDGHVAELDADQTTSSEILARHLSGSTLVKAFNTMYFVTLANGGTATRPPDQRLAMYLAGDAAQAKQTVAQLIGEMGFTPIDTGSLALGGRVQQPGSPVYGQDLTASDARNVLAQERS
jgi:8-hydroxy-5-deazaflavin:NADPH oxidoreductase